jgi:hypothetical protein
MHISRCITIFLELLVKMNRTPFGETQIGACMFHEHPRTFGPICYCSVKLKRCESLINIKPERRSYSACILTIKDTNLLSA